MRRITIYLFLQASFIFVVFKSNDRKVTISEVENCSIKIIVEKVTTKNIAFKMVLTICTYTHFVVHTMNFTSKEIMTYLLSSHCISFFTVKNAVTRKMGWNGPQWLNNACMHLACTYMLLVYTFYNVKIFLPKKMHKAQVRYDGIF